MSVERGMTCEINILAIQIMSILSIVAAFCSAVAILRYLISRCYEQRTAFIFTKKAKSLFPVFFLFYDFIVICLGGLRLTGNIIGRDLSVTILYSLQMQVEFSGLILFYFNCINFLQLNMIGNNSIPVTVMGKIDNKLGELSIYAWV